MHDFDDIRPYHDKEVAEVVNRVIRDDEFIELITDYRFPFISKYAKGYARELLHKIVAMGLYLRFGGFKDVGDIQAQVEAYMSSMIERSTHGYTTDGLKYINPQERHLFLGNHRDITLDPALINYTLHNAKFSTVRIAIGDNLLSKSWASDLMRLNKSFIVKRAITKPRELLRSLIKLSSYVYHSLNVDNEHVWIAHREGRAKDGIDKTDVAVLKMIFLAKPKAKSFEEYLYELNVVPLSISYEFDPCIAMKARELRLRKTAEGYQKSEHEDLESIGLGISGQKGRVHLQILPPLNRDKDREKIKCPETLAQYLDEKIVSAYRLFPNNFFAYGVLYGEENCRKMMDKLHKFGMIEDFVITGFSSARVKEAFNQHLTAVPLIDRPQALHCYANPVVSKLSLLND